MAAMIDQAADSSVSCVVPPVVQMVSLLLQRAAERNDAVAASVADSVSGAVETRKVVSAFHGLTKPTISVPEYMERIFRYAGCSTSCYVVAYIYLDRFNQRHPSLPIDSLNVHRFLITSILLAVKFLDDIYYNNAYFAKVGGISLGEMNFLEVDLLFGLGFELNVTPTAFASYCSILQREIYANNPGRPMAVPRLQSCFLTAAVTGEEDSGGGGGQHLRLTV